MVLNDLKRLMDENRITPYRFWKDTGLHKATAYKLYEDPSYIPGREVMEKIARAYGWEPKSYITYIPDEQIRLAQRLTAPV